MKTRFKGHETFYFRDGWMTKVFTEIHSNNNYTLFTGNNGIPRLGVGSNMVKSIKYWMTTCNLLKYVRHKQQGYDLSDLGKVIAGNDFYLEDMFSLWILHINLVLNKENATTWYIFFNLFQAENFTVEEAFQSIRNILNQRDVKYAPKSVESDVNVLLNMYTRKNVKNEPEENFTCPLSRLNLIKVSGDQYYKMPPNLNSLSEFAIFYAIICLMGENTNHISITNLENDDESLTHIFNINRVIINDYLEKLAIQGYIRVERTAGLDMLYLQRKMSPLDIVKEYYSRRKQNEV